MRKARLSTTSVERLVDSAVLPSFEWATPEFLDVLLFEPFDSAAPVTADNPPRMLFVVHSARASLPTESGHLHLHALADDVQVLAPWAIDDATDLLFEASAPAEQVLSLATDSLRGVFWGLHDWAHFHSHGPFERIAETELQCDVAALAWLWENREALGLDASHYVTMASQIDALWATRFEQEARAYDVSRAWGYLALRTGVDALAPRPCARG